jgi:hypothetical protein
MVMKNLILADKHLIARRMPSSGMWRRVVAKERGEKDFGLIVLLRKTFFN